MNRPTAEEFAQAPLFKAYLPYEDVLNQAYTDYSGDKVVIQGFELTREDTEEGMRFFLEGVPLLDVVRSQVEGSGITWRGTFYNDRTHVVLGVDENIARERFAEEIESLVTARPDSLAFHMEANGKTFKPEWVEMREGFNYDDTSEDEEDEADWEHKQVGPYEERLGPPVRIVRKGFQAWVEGEEAPRPWGEVREEHCRVCEEGYVLCPASVSILEQAHRMGSRPPEMVSRHRADLKELRAMIADPGELQDLSVRANTHMFDMVDSDAKDPVVPQEAIMAYRQRVDEAGIEMPVRLAGHADGLTDDDLRVHPENLPDVVDPTNPPVPAHELRPLDQLMRQSTGFEPAVCRELRTMPTYFWESIRAIGRELLTPHIGEYPMEKVICAQPRKGDQEEYTAFMCFWQEGELVKEVGEITHRLMPGYKTSPASVWRRDGWDALVFSDFNGTYAYARPTPGYVNDLKRDGEQPEEANGFTM